MVFRQRGKTLLLVIDMQEGFRYPAVEKIIPNVNKLIQAYGQNTIFLSFSNPTNSWYEKVLKWKKFQKKADQKIIRGINYGKQPVFEHRTYEIFTPELLLFLQKKKIERIVLCGVYSDVCIQLAALKAFDMELPAAVIEDACVSQHSQTLHKATMTSLKHSIGKEHVLHTHYLTH